MANSIGIVMAERIVGGVVSTDGKLAGHLHEWPADPEDADQLLGMPAEDIVRQLRDEIVAVASQQEIRCIGLGLPGIISQGIVQDSPNLVQLKGVRIQERLAAALAEAGIQAAITVNNDADAIAAGVAATKGQLEKTVRVWTLGSGIGYGHYPAGQFLGGGGIWEGGHMVVSLDSKETYCGCGGRGHLEGFCGYRAMRLRFMDMEPEEIFEAARPRNMKQGDPRCVEFVKQYHRALAAATANCIHQEGPGKFYFTGFAVKFLDLNTLQDYLQQMVKLSPLQNYTLEVIPDAKDLGVIGAAVTAMKADS